MNAVILNSSLLALGLALESVMVAVANGLNNTGIRRTKMFAYAALFAVCHAVALVTGYVFAVVAFDGLSNLYDYLNPIAVAVLLYLGVKMCAEGVFARSEIGETKRADLWETFVQSTVASFDALAVGLTVPQYSAVDIFLCAAIISSVIFVFYNLGFIIGLKFGAKFSGVSGIIGGLVFIGLAAEITFGGFL